MCEDDLKIGGYCITQQLKSRNNAVYIAKKCGSQQDVVLKIFSQKQRMDRELEVKDILKKYRMKTPDVLNVFSSAVVYQMIDAPNVLSLLDWGEEANISPREVGKWLIKICNYLLEYNQVTGLILGDSNLRNFLLFDNEIWGIDFEVSKRGGVEEDIGRLIAFIITYDPKFSKVKLCACRLLMNEIKQWPNLCISSVIHYYLLEISNICVRRENSIATALIEQATSYIFYEEDVVSRITIW